MASDWTIPVFVTRGIGPRSRPARMPIQKQSTLSWEKTCLVKMMPCGERCPSAACSPRFLCAAFLRLRQRRLAVLDVHRGWNAPYGFADQIQWEIVDLLEPDARLAHVELLPSLRPRVAEPL